MACIIWCSLGGNPYFPIAYIQQQLIFIFAPTILSMLANCNSAQRPTIVFRSASQLNCFYTMDAESSLTTQVPR
jgi:hypothetical protein